MHLRFTALESEATLPGRTHEDDAGLDLRSIGQLRLGPGERGAVRTGLAVEIPRGHAGLVLPRSGLARRSGVTILNAPGLIDPGYRGEVEVLLLNTDPATDFEVAAGDRIAQLLVVPFAEAAPVLVDRLDETSRGEGGFGSTGVD